MKLVLNILFLFVPLVSFGQIKNDTVKVLAKLINEGEGDKVYIATYFVLKVIKGEVSNDTIKVGYYFYKEPEKVSGNTVLTLFKYTGQFGPKDYYTFPDYNGTTGSIAIKE